VHALWIFSGACAFFPDGKRGIRGSDPAAEEGTGIRAEAGKRSGAAFLRHKGEGL